MSRRDELDALRVAREARAKAILTRLPSGPVRGVEVGVMSGQLSACLLRRPDLHLLMVDLWPVPASRINAIRNTEFAELRRTVIHAESPYAARFVQDDWLDFVFVDADHSYAACSADIRGWLPKLKAGGMMAGHDYRNPEFPGVQQAVDLWARETGVAVETGDEFTWFAWPKGRR